VSEVPKWVIPTFAVLFTLSLIPLALIARARATHQQSPRINIMPDMDIQSRFEPQSENALFADGRAMRPTVQGTIARGQLQEDALFFTGRSGNQWTAASPVPVTTPLMQRGRERFEIYCAPCHGIGGYGDGMIAKRADALQEGTWTPPLSLHSDLVRSQPDGQIFNTITHGIRSMPSYSSQIPTADRWAIVAYVRALQRSQNARLEDVPADVQPTLR
jgi:mono/diheme cytochrome c family protein